MNSDANALPPIVAQGLPAGMIVAGVLSLERQLRDNAFLRLAGDASYAIYLVHVPVLAMVGSMLFGHVEPGFSASLILVASGVLVGVLVHVVIERPMMRDIQNVLRRIEHRHRVRPEAASQKA